MPVWIDKAYWQCTGLLLAAYLVGWGAGLSMAVALL